MLMSLLSLLAVDSIIQNPAPIDIPDTSSFLSANSYPQKTANRIAPVLQAEAILTADLETGQILYQKNSHQQMSVASLAKLMTVLIVLEENQMEETVTISKEATSVEPSKIYLYPDEQITVRNLIKSIIIKSANDSALALAIHNSGDVESFVAKMNTKAKELGMHNTSFANPIGFDDEKQYSTAADMLILGRLAMKNPFIQSTAPIKETEISSTNEKLSHKLSATNSLLDSYLNVLGLKTGTTDDAGQCLISVVQNEKGNTIINVVLNSPSRFNESKILSEWIFQSYQWI